MSIRFKVLMSMMAAFLAVTLFLGGFMYKRFDNVLVNQIKSDINGVVSENKHNLDCITMGIGRSFASVAFNELIIDALMQEQHSQEEKSKNRILVMNEYKDVFELSLGSYVSDYALHFYINKESGLADSFKKTNHDTFNNKEFGMYSTENIENERWYRETIKSEAPWYIFRVEENPEYIFFSKAIYVQNIKSGSHDRYLGTGVVGINCKQLIIDMNRSSVTDNTVIAILDNMDTVVSKNSYEISDEFIANTMNKNDIGLNMSDQIETDDYIITRARSNAGITFVSFTTKNSIYLQTKSVRTVVIFAIVAALLIAFLLIAILSYYLTNPIKKLSHHMRNMDYNNLSISRVETGAKDEVGELYRAFNIMIGKIEESIRRENEQNEKTRKTEIQMLQAQINPHFLYNVLDSISWLAMENGQDGIGEMADLLSQLFSYSIRDGKIMATLREELESVEKYVALQKNRYADNISLQIDADEDCLEESLPKCILQPLVENSIVHGINDSDKGICIKISVKKNEGVIEILSEDNGKGCDLEKLNAILKDTDERLTKFHLGIRNVAIRLRQLYGSECGLSYMHNDSGGITARILLPVNIK